VRGGIDAERRTRDDREPSLAQACGHLGGHHLAIRRGAAGSDHGRTALTGHGDVDGPADPEAVGRCLQIVQASRPLRVAGADDPRRELGPDLKVSFNIEHLETGRESFDSLSHAGGRHNQGSGRTVLGDQTICDRVSGLGNPTPGGSREPVL
jgi:hypothetical protein